MKKVLIMGSVAVLSIAVGVGSVSAMGGKGGKMGRGFTDRPDFSEMDANGDGHISVDEIKAHQAAGLAGIDTDGDGLISVEELTAHFGEKAAERAQRMAENMIQFRDDDGDGSLSVDELNMSRGMERMFLRADTDGDGMISESEYEAMADKVKEHRGKKGKKNKSGH